MSQVTEERMIDGVSVPPAGEYQLDPEHTAAQFVSRHMLSKVRGRFTELEGTVTIAEKPEDSSVSVTIKTASVASGSQMRDGHLRSGDFFDVEEYPDMTFVSTGVRFTGGNGLELDGDLTIKDVTQPVTLAGTFLGWGPDAMGDATRLFAEVAARVNREDWDLTWNTAVELTGVLVPKEVDLEITVEAVLPADA
jgi:polyisoprenoid-binding protein YceI